ncbi:MAG: hypothetical protein A2Y79_01895 [Deltaproteobacteria bacterium RBG_13_43_22]|nr:MAG: hypothetical protein A2Y79_01895 [Deltaproteobacteria bacterium RBG_13_43_22]
MDRTKYKKEVFLTFFLLWVLLNGQEKVKAEEWKPFSGKQSDGSYFAYDQDSVIRVSSTTVLVWEKRVGSNRQKSKARGKKGGAITMRLWEINCKKRTGKLLSIKEFDQDENLLSSLNTNESTQAESISPRSMGEALYSALCPKRKR